MIFTRSVTARLAPGSPRAYRLYAGIFSLHVAFPITRHLVVRALWIELTMS